MKKKTMPKLLDGFEKPRNKVMQRLKTKWGISTLLDLELRKTLRKPWHGINLPQIKGIQEHFTT